MKRLSLICFPKSFADNGVRALLNVQSQLGSLRIPGHEKGIQKLVEPIQHDCHILMWKHKTMMRELEKVKEEQSKRLPGILREKKERDILWQAVQCMSTFD